MGLLRWTLVPPPTPRELDRHRQKGTFVVARCSERLLLTPASVILIISRVDSVFRLFALIADLERHLKDHGRSERQRLVKDQNGRVVRIGAASHVSPSLRSSYLEITALTETSITV